MIFPKTDAIEAALDTTWSTWTPTYSDAVGTVPVVTLIAARYKITGNVLQWYWRGTVTNRNGAAFDFRILGIPVNPTNTIGGTHGRNETADVQLQTMCTSVGSIILWNENNGFPFTADGQTASAFGINETA